MSSAHRFMQLIAFVFGFLCWLPLFLAGLPLILVGILTKFFKAVWLRLAPKPVSWQNLIEYMPEVGWKPRANMNAHVRVDGVYRLTTDRHGWRGSAKIDDCNVVVFGDSYAFGYGVDDKDYFANHADGLRIKAIGVNGYNMVQELWWMHRLKPKLKDKLVVWFVYHGNDLLENLTPNLAHYRMPFLRLDASTQSWQIVTDHVSAKPWTTSKARDYYKSLATYCQPSRAPERIFDACAFLIKEGKSVCEDTHSQLVVMSIPDVTQIVPSHAHVLTSFLSDSADFDPDYPDKKLKAICDGLSIPFVTLKDYLSAEDHKSRDPHWNAGGHYKVAAAIQESYRKYHPLA